MSITPGTVRMEEQKDLELRTVFIERTLIIRTEATVSAWKDFSQGNKTDGRQMTDTEIRACELTKSQEDLANEIVEGISILPEDRISITTKVTIENEQGVAE